MKKSRIWELDFFRGFAIIMVLIDHTMYDLCYMCSSWRHCGIAFMEILSQAGYDYMTGDVRFFWRPSFLFLFFCISGVCTAFSHNNMIRGFRLFGVSVAVSVLTYIAQMLLNEECFILMGVLHCLAIITVCYALFDGGVTLLFRLLKKKKNIPDPVERISRAVSLLLLSVVFLLLNMKYNVKLNEVFRYGKTISYNNDWRGLFFYEKSWWTADYFPLFPFISFFFFGAALSEVLYHKRRSLLPCLDGKWHYVFSVPGRYSLWIYLAGQVVAVGLCYLLTAVFIG